jgi:hypothetical protein
MTGVGSAFGAAKPSGYGYRIGDPAADFAGYDQYMKWRKMSDNLGSWILIDLCPVWCPPCNFSAQFHFAFTEYIRGQGIPFHIQPVVVESDTRPNPSTRLNAEGWAVKYQLEREALLHDNGDANSPLRQLVHQYAQANGSAIAPYPTYVLIDPTGVIRDYIQGANLMAIQADLATMTGTTLTGDWSDPAVLPTYGLVADPSVGSVSFNLWDGTAISLSGGGHLEDSHCIYDTSGPIILDLVDKLGDPVTAGPAVVQDHSKLLDLHSPISMGFKATVEPAPGTYRRPTSPTFDFVEVSPSYYPGGPAIKGKVSPAATFNPDGSMHVNFTPSDFFASGWVGSTDDDRASNYVEGGCDVGDPIFPYQATLDLSGNVNGDPTLSSTTISTVTSLLQGGLGKLGNRDYAGSAQQFGKAATNLQGSAWAATATEIQAHVAWLGTHY